MIIKKSLSLLLAVIMIGMTFTALPITANAVDVDAAAIGDGTVIDVSTAAELEAACSTINENGGTYTINVTANITNGIIDIHHSDAVVTVIGNGNTITQPASAVHVSNGAELTLGDEQSTLIIRGTDEPHTTPEDQDDPGCIYVLPGSVCNMKSGVTITKHRRNNYLGGGVSVQGGTFHMYGGTIDHCGVDGGSVCYGGGVAVYAGGTFIMDGGTISNCYATTDYIEDDPRYANCYSGMGGGVFVTDGSVFTMNGGTITGNTATNFGGGVAMTLSDAETQINPDTDEEIVDPDTGKGYIDLGNPRSRAAIYGGTISNNTANSGAGVFASGLIYSFAHTLAAGILDTGDPFEPGLFIDGGENKTVEISSNKATDMGGGVMVTGLRNTRKAQIHNAEIINNTAAKGAGVMNYSYWTQLDIDGCTISNNTSTSNGGGIAALLNSGQGQVGYTKIKDTTITYNISGDRGAGVYYDADSEIRLSGANTIQNNTYNSKANNLNVLSVEKPVKVVGDLTGSQIGLSDPTLWDDGKEDYDADAVSTIRLTDGFKANNASLIPAGAFTSDHESWYVDFGEKKTVDIPETTYYTYTARTYPVTSRSPGTVDDSENIFYVDLETDVTRVDGWKTLQAEINKRMEKYNAVEGVDNLYTDPDTGVTIRISYTNNNNICWITVYSDDYPRTIAALVSFQEAYGEDGKLALYFYSSYRDNVTVSDNYSEEEIIESDEQIPNNTEDYVYNDIGFVTGKTFYTDEEEHTIYNQVTEYDYTNEVRLVHRTKVDYHINNDEIIAASYNDNDYTTDDDIFTDEINAAGTTVTVGDTINKFYTIPEVVPTDTNSCPYIFKGWYYDKENDNDSHPVNFGTDKYAKDIYAHWIKVEDVEKDENDLSMLQSGETTYGGFDLAGVQIRQSMLDKNFNEITPGGMRFITSLSMDVVKKINALQPDNPNNIEYGYVAAKYDGTSKSWIDYHNGYEKLQYVSDGANGINTTNTTEKDEDYFGFAHNVKCTSGVANRVNNEVRRDHQNYDEYLLYSFVVTYEGADATGKDIDVLARPYIHYTDANGSERVAYSEYLGNANMIGGCCISYNDIVAKSGN